MKNSIKQRNISFISIIFSLLLLMACNSKQENYLITGSIDEIHKVDSVFIVNVQTQEKLNSAVIKDGKFTLRGKTDQIMHTYISTNGKNPLIIELILENDNYQFYAGTDTMKLTGGHIHKIVLGYTNEKEYLKISKNYYETTEKCFSNIDMNDKEAVEKAREIVMKASRPLLEYETMHHREVIEGNYPTIAKMFSVVKIHDMKNYPIKKCKELLIEYEKEIGTHPTIKFYRDNIKLEEESRAMEQSVAKGRLFKEVIAKDTEGNEIKLSDIVKKNKYTILEFWASWCGPCRAEIPNLKKAYKKYKKAGLEIISISLDKEENNWQKALKEENTNWINCIVPDSFSNSYVKGYGVMGIPASFLITQKGTIVARYMELREFNLDETLKKFLKK